MSKKNKNAARRVSARNITQDNVRWYRKTTPDVLRVRINARLGCCVSCRKSVPQLLAEAATFEHLNAEATKLLIELS